jgi:hypothetical protein
MLCPTPFMGLTCSPTENCDVLSKGFYYFFLFGFVHAINLKNKPCFSTLDGMPVVNVVFPTREDVELKLVP